MYKNFMSNNIVSQVIWSPRAHVHLSVLGKKDEKAIVCCLLILLTTLKGKYKGFNSTKYLRALQ